MLFVEMRRLRFSLVATEPIDLPSYKGSALHGGFGHALETISPTWFSYFFQPQTPAGNTIPKPFVLLPPLDQQTNYQTGETFDCELTLFASATQHVAIVQAATEKSAGHYLVHTGLINFLFSQNVMIDTISVHLCFCQL